MSLALTVVSDFGSYRRGDQITDASAIEKILASDQSPSVVKIDVPDAKPPALPKPADPAP